MRRAMERDLHRRALLRRHVHRVDHDVVLGQQGSDVLLREPVRNDDDVRMGIHRADPHSLHLRLVPADVVDRPVLPVQVRELVGPGVHEDEPGRARTNEGPTQAPPWSHSRRSRTGPRGGDSWTSGSIKPRFRETSSS